MKFTTKTEYGLVALVYMARHGWENWVSIREIAKQEKFSPTYSEKIFQALRAADIVTSHPGKRGGYALSRHPSEVTLRQIVEALEGSTFDVYCEPEIREHIVCTHFCMCGIRPVWARTKKLLDEFFSSVTLEMIAKEEKESQSLVGVGGKTE